MKLGLVKLDQVLHLAAGTVHRVVQPLGAATGLIGHDVAYVEPLLRGFDPGCNAALAPP